jgi:hypothetical protein
MTKKLSLLAIAEILVSYMPSYYKAQEDWMNPDTIVNLISGNEQPNYSISRPKARTVMIAHARHFLVRSNTAYMRLLGPDEQPAYITVPATKLFSETIERIKTELLPAISQTHKADLEYLTAKAKELDDDEYVIKPSYDY